MFDPFETRNRLCCLVPYFDTLLSNSDERSERIHSKVLQVREIHLA